MQVTNSECFQQYEKEWFIIKKRGCGQQWKEGVIPGGLSVSSAADHLNGLGQIISLQWKTPVFYNISVTERVNIAGLKLLFL